MKAAVGDRITVHGLHVGDATRCGEVLEVKGAGGEPRDGRCHWKMVRSCPCAHTQCTYGWARSAFDVDLPDLKHKAPQTR